MDQFEFTVEIAGQRADAYLAQRTGRTRSFVQNQILAGKILRNEKALDKPSQRLHLSDRLEGRFEEAPPSELFPVARALEILFEDQDLLALNKPQGVVVHPAASHRCETLVHHLLHYLGQTTPFLETSATRPGIVHRLDKDTSGVLLVAKHSRALEALSSQFKKREIKKEYRAIAWGTTRPSGLVQSAIGRDPNNRKKHSSKSSTPRVAVICWTRIENFRHFSSLALFPETGRTHQLRVHLAESRHPILCDALYGGAPTKNRIAKIATEIVSSLSQMTYLHAYRLNFTHPFSGKTLSLEAPLPANFSDLLNSLRAYDA